MTEKELKSIDRVGEEQLSSIVRNSLGWQVTIVDCHHIPAGHNNTLYDIRTLNPAHHVVLRIAANEDQPLRRYEHERTIMLAEPFKYDLMRKAGVPTARVLAMDGSRSIIERDYIIVDYIDAVPMNHPSVPAEARPHIMREVGRYTALMHGITADKFGWITSDGSIKGSESWAEVFGELISEAYAKWLDAEMIGSAEVDAALDCYWKHRSIFDECRVPAFVHNDIWDPNIMVNQKNGSWRIEAIIDTDGAMFADRELEFVIWEGADKDFLSGYGGSIDSSANAALRRKFYRMQLYMQYSWFYLVHSMDSGFQVTTKNIVMDILKELLNREGR